MPFYDIIMENVVYYMICNQCGIDKPETKEYWYIRNTNLQPLWWRDNIIKGKKFLQPTER
jgi:hypothetical protein